MVKRTSDVVLSISSHGMPRPKYQFTRYRPWNTRTYPVWKDGDQRFRSAWTGGEVTFDVKNDSPTLTGARATFTININFPQNQTTLANGEVVWAQNCTIDGNHYHKGQLVYPDHNNWTGVFPNGATFHKGKDKKNRFVYVWKAWGRYWQVADGPSSTLSLNTRDTPLGSYNMEVVIYHCRNKDKFIPLGYASTVFTITDQVPFTLSLSQLNDVNKEDRRFIQKRAISFDVKIHDPSQYLDSADISFSWDFGDSSGTLISREMTVTHTYLDVGTFTPQVVLMATIPQTCGGPTVVAPIDASAAAAEVVVAPTVSPLPTAPADGGDAEAQDVPASDAPPLAVSLQPPAADQGTEDAGAAVVVVVASVAPAVNAAVEPANTVAPAAGADVAAVTAAAAGEVADAADADAAATAAAAVEAAVVTDALGENVPVVADTVAVAEEEAAVEVAAIVTVAPVAAVDTDVADAAATPAPVANAEVNNVVADVDAAAEVVQAQTEAPVADIVVTVAPEAIAVEEAAAATENAVAATAAPAAAEVDPSQVALVVAKRDVSETLDDCNVYRYGSLATSLDVIQAIESVEIVQMSGVLSLATELDQNAVDVTVICQGSLPREVCTVISDADCVTPMETICNEARPSPDCQMILRSFFNDTGVFCINVSLTNDVSFAEASARVSVSLASTGSPAGTAVTVLGVMVLACVVCCVGLMYRRFKQYQPLREDSPYNNGGSSGVTSVPMLLWNLLSRQSAGESRPLLHGRVV
ncbi:premelanosome protein a [Cheilinus undulatus]|uniref:premelanosome protein a n=1 Tax=Cheilinus undulatus TaxID=241271 RepID=UPI001BD63D37|nr:premelanosome protein a [Cheilinus undulatus]